MNDSGSDLKGFIYKNKQRSDLGYKPCFANPFPRLQLSMPFQIVSQIRNTLSIMYVQ